MRRIADREFTAVLARAAIGAGSSIDIGLSFSINPDWMYWLRDLPYACDDRLRRRLLLVGIDHKPLNEFTARELRPFLDAGWQVRIAPYNRLGLTIIVDGESGFYGPSARGRKAPELSEYENSREIGLFRRMFVQSWKLGRAFEVVYRKEGEEEPDIIKLVKLSDEHFTRLIKFFARHPEKMREMNPRDFEELIAELLSKEGLKVEITPITRDKGRDIIAVSDSSLGRHLHLVECKRYSETNPVTVNLVRSLYGVVEAEKATAGMLVTTTRFTPPAAEFVDSVRNRLAKKDYQELTKWIRKHAT
jgi:hypothetical protein